MIEKLKVTSYLGESIEIDLRKPLESGYIIKNITGLQPPKATINTTKIAVGDGSLYNSSKVENRNIVITIIPYDAEREESIETLRQLSYRYFPIGKKVTLIFKTENRTASCVGYVEANEYNIFSKIVETQISIICPDPYFYAYLEEGIPQHEFSNIIPVFEFPIDHKDHTIELSLFESTASAIITYVGDVSTGVKLTLFASGEVYNPTFYNLTTGETMHIDTTRFVHGPGGTSLVEGDKLVITTSRGNKRATLYREGTSYNVLNCITRNSVWFQLRRGDNKFTFLADAGTEYLEAMVENDTVYEGL